MPSWDRRSPERVAKLQDHAVHLQVRDLIGPFSPFWRERFAALGVRATQFTDVASITRLPAIGERDVCPDGDPASAARLVLQADESGFALHAPGPAVRRALARRLTSVDAYRRTIEHDTKPTSYTFTGLAMRFPIASTRHDLDIVARAGARLWQVLGLESHDVLVSAYPVGHSAEHQALYLAALASGTPAFFVGDDVALLAETIAMVAPTVLAAASPRAADLIDELDDDGGALESLRTVLLVGAPTEDERLAASEALARAAPQAKLLAVHAPSGARVLWGECRESAERRVPSGLHTYPDLDVVQTVDAETGIADSATDAPGELVLTQLQFHGSALLRWRTGDIVQERLQRDACPACGRGVPRVPSEVRRTALVTAYDRARSGLVDLRSVTAALAGRQDIADWRVVIETSRRNGRHLLLVHVVPTGDEAEVAVGAARDTRTASGVLPAQVIVTSADDLPTSDGGVAVTPRVFVRD